MTDPIPVTHEDADQALLLPGLEADFHAAVQEEEAAEEVANRLQGRSRELRDQIASVIALRDYGIALGDVIEWIESNRWRAKDVTHRIRVKQIKVAIQSADHRRLLGDMPTHVYSFAGLIVKANGQDGKVNRTCYDPKAARKVVP